mgnify:FL=1|jgi:hypothetical protein
MLYDAVDDAAAHTPEEIRSAYFRQLRSALSVANHEAVESVDEATLEAISAGDEPELRVEDAAAVLSVDPDRPDAKAIVAELRDHLLMSMTTCVVDVDTIAANIEFSLSGQEVQQALEGRTRMTLAQLAAIQQFLAKRKDN